MATEGTLGSRIGDLLLSAGLVDQRQIDFAVTYQRKVQTKLGSALVAIGAIDEKILGAFLAIQRGGEVVHLAKREVNPEILALISPETARRLGAIPIEKKGEVLQVGMVDPQDAQAIRDLEAESHLKVQGFIAPLTSIQQALARLYPEHGAAYRYPEHQRAIDVEQIRTSLRVIRSMVEAIEREL